MHLFHLLFFYTCVCLIATAAGWHLSPHGSFPLTTRRPLDPCLHIYRPRQDMVNQGVQSLIPHIFLSAAPKSCLWKPQHNTGSLVFNWHPVSGGSGEHPDMDFYWCGFWVAASASVSCILLPAVKNGAECWETTAAGLPFLLLLFANKWFNGLESKNNKLDRVSLQVLLLKFWYILYRTENLSEITRFLKSKQRQRKS